MSGMNVALVQMRVTDKKQENLDKAIRYIEEGAKRGADLIVLPEMFCCPYQTNKFPFYAEPEEGMVWQTLSKAAKDCKVYIIGGSMPEIDLAGKIYNTSYSFSPNGGCVAKHRKIHLFNIDIERGHRFNESETMSPGNSVTVFQTPMTVIGVNICYDFRFPELSRLMVDAGAEVIVCPAAYNMTTGPAHWELMFRSRAVDNQVYTIGVAPARDESASYVSYANSIVVSPWGVIESLLSEKEEMLLVNLDLEKIRRIREQLPLLDQRRQDVYQLNLC